MANTKKKRRSGAGTAIYVVLLTLWTLLIAAVCLFILSQIWAYASVYDETQVEPVIESYIDNLRENLWDDSIAETVEYVLNWFGVDIDIEDALGVREW